MQGYLRENIALICNIIHDVFVEYSWTVFPLIPLYDDSTYWIALCVGKKLDHI